ncbi:hypothetical protein ACTXGW_09230 [Psychrobacter faecalis]|uniref:hypothetical protein n=1 Tax=Psychrobacter faecalis TaxID=180588 RepID=UPI003FD1BDE8
MKAFKITALALASTLALAGCGSDSDNNGNGPNTPNVPTKPPVDNNLTEIEQAKEMIRTAKLFVSDNKAVTESYKDVSDILTEKQASRLSYTFEVPNSLYYYMQKNGLSQLNAADIIALANDKKFNNTLGNVALVPEKGFVANLNADGQFKLSGTTKVNVKEYDYAYNPTTGGLDETLVSQDTFTAAFDGFENALVSNTNSASFNGGIGFKSIKIGSGADTVTLSSNKGFTVNGQFSDKVVVDDEFDLNDINREGITLEKAIVKLGNLKLTANDSVIEAKDLEFAALDISKKSADNSLVVRTIPYKLAITGQMTKQKPKTNVAITLNATANDADIKNFLTVTDAGNLEEKANKYVGMTIVLNMKGNVTKEGSTTIPLDFQANLERTARNVIDLKGLKASVEGKELFVTGKSNLDNNYDVVSTQFTVKQNKASIELKVDANGDFVKDKMGKLGDIMVDGKDYGDLMDNDGKITAKFKDNSLIVL